MYEKCLYKAPDYIFSVGRTILLAYYAYGSFIPNYSNYNLSIDLQQ